MCAAGDREARGLAERLERSRREPDRDRYFTAVERATRAVARRAAPALERLAALERPPGEDARLKAWLADQRRRLSLLQDLADAYATRDEAAIARLAADVDELGQRARRVAEAFGMPSCAPPA